MNVALVNLEPRSRAVFEFDDLLNHAQPHCLIGSSRVKANEKSAASTAHWYVQQQMHQSQCTPRNFCM